MGLENARIAGWTAGIILLLAGCARNADTYVRKGNQLYAAGKYGDAEINYRKAIQTQGNNGEAYYRLGLTYLKEGKRLEAENALLTAADGKPPVPGAKSQLADLRLEEYVADPQHQASCGTICNRLLMKYLLATRARSMGCGFAAPWR